VQQIDVRIPLEQVGCPAGIADALLEFIDGAFFIRRDYDQVKFAMAALVFFFFLLVGRVEELSDVNHRSSFFPMWLCSSGARDISRFATVCPGIPACYSKPAARLRLPQP
jgi:hypothetical protein